MWKLDGMALVSVSAPPLRAMRTKSLIRRDPTDHWVITIGKRAATRLISESDQTLVPAGVPFVVSLGDFFANQRDLDDRIQLNISRDRFGAIASALDAARGRPVSTALGGMLSEYIRLLERQLPGLTDEDAHGLPQAIAAMVAACVAPSVDRIATAQGQISATLKDKARRCIQRNLRSPHLGANMLCRELGMSRSSSLPIAGNGGRRRTVHPASSPGGELCATKRSVQHAVDYCHRTMNWGCWIPPPSVVHSGDSSASARLTCVRPCEPVWLPRSRQHVEIHGMASADCCPGSRFVAFCRDEHIAGKANAPILDASDSERTVGAIICGPRVKEWKPSNINAGLPLRKKTPGSN